ncbi:MAG: thiamine pyrophosphate-dependent enzyme [Pseudomonadota bacterium]
MAVSDADRALAAEVVRVRLAQMLVNERNKARDFPVPVHLGLGHEAVAVAVVAALAEEDRLLLSHRNIHYNLARQPSLRAEIDEYRLLPSGLAGGRLGSMNLANPAAGIVYTSSVLGNNLGVGAGVALGGQMAGRPGITVVVSGDGAMEEGQFYESLLLLKSFALPALVVIENNQWSMYTRIEERRCPIDVERLGSGLGVPYRRLAGNDVCAYREALSALRAAAIAGRTPVLVEVLLHTLGDWIIEEPGRPGRHVNYHHGVAPSVMLCSPPIIREDDGDPVYALGQRFGVAEIAALSDSLLARLQVEMQ